MLIDNEHSTLCLDAAGTMQAEVKGQHVALVEPKGGTGPLAHSLIVMATLTDGMRAVRKGTRTSDFDGLANDGDVQADYD